MHLFLIRHAQSVANTGAPEAPIDCSLTSQGEQQAEAVAERLAGQKIDLVLSSPYLRTLQTADAIRVRCGVPARIVARLHEHHMLAFPQNEPWPLMAREALCTRFPHFGLDDDFVDVDWFSTPEAQDEGLNRARGTLAWLRAEYGNRNGIRIAIVSHGSPVSKLVQAFLDVPTSEGLGLEIDNASVSTLEYRPDVRWVHGVNRVEHLHEIASPAR